jgi:hypothetical protein
MARRASSRIIQRRLGGAAEEIAGSPFFWGPAEKHRRHVRDDATAGLKGSRVSSIVAGVVYLYRAVAVESSLRDS